jgi:hypothetical protein
MFLFLQDVPRVTGEAAGQMSSCLCRNENSNQKPIGCKSMQNALLYLRGIFASSIEQVEG